MEKYFKKSYWVITILLIVCIGFAAKQSRAANADYLYQILSTGQSLSVGALGTPPLTTTQPYNNKMLAADNKTIIPLVEPSITTQAVGGETIGSAMANSLSAAEGSDFQTVVTNHGWGGYYYSQLKKGAIAVPPIVYTPYAVGMVQLNSVHAAAAAMGKVHKVIGVTTIHGESDQVGIMRDWAAWQSFGYTKPQDVYRDFLVEWQRDYETDVKAVTGQAGVVPMYTDQMSSNTGNPCGAGKAGTSVACGQPHPVSAFGQLEAAEENPGKIILVGPKYFLTYGDTVYHLNNYSYRLLGEYYGKVIDQVFNKGKQWMPLTPTSITRSGNIVSAKFHIPDPATQIQFDTVAVDAMPNMGFEYFDSSGLTAIKKVEIVGTDTVQITLNAAPPEGFTQALAYAYTGIPGAGPGPHSYGSVKGNLRDNDPTVSAYDASTHLYNWAVHFYKPITLATTPAVAVDTTPPITTVSPVGGTYASTQSVTLTANEPTTIYYTLDGSTPTASSTQYTGPIAIQSTKTLKYFAKDPAGNSGGVGAQLYTIVIATTNTKINVPTPANVVGRSISASQIDLTWTTGADNIGVAGYKIYRHNIQIATTTTTSYSDTGLFAGTEYKYTVVAFDTSLNSSAQSNEVTVVTRVAPVVNSSGGGGSPSYIPPVTTTQTSNVIASTTATSVIGATQGATQTQAAPAGASAASGGEQGTIVAGNADIQYAQFGTYVTKKHLALKSKGADVKKLQEFLKADGFLKEAPTGYYGKATQIAVEAFQREHNIVGPGQVGYGEIGVKTRAMINQHLTGAPMTSMTSASDLDVLKNQIALLQQKVLELLEQLAVMKRNK